jgi:acyl-CoA thioesterase I
MIMIQKTSVRLLSAILLMCCLLSGWQSARASTTSTTSDPPVKIMPFGDSITTSVGSTTRWGVSIQAQASYRYWLDHSLHDGLVPFIFIGTQTENTWGPPKYSDFDHHHEGYSGKTTLDFLAPANSFYIDKILTSQSAGTTISNIPDMVLLHLGTNDVALGFSNPEITAHLGTLIDHFRTYNRNVIILLAQIIPCATTTIYPPPHDSQPWCTKIASLNAAIPALAAQKSNLFSPVVVVDQYSGFNPAAGADTYDSVHPNESGEKKMAAKWLTAIEKWYTYKPKQAFIPSLSK